MRLITLDNIEIGGVEHPQTRPGQSTASNIASEEGDNLNHPEPPERDAHSSQRAANAPSEAGFQVLAERFNLSLWAAKNAI